MLDDLFAHGGVWFAVPAIAGTGFFALRLLLLLVGAHAGLEGAEADPSGVDAQHMDATTAGKLLTVQSVTGFVMGFGWGGLIGLKGLGLDLGPSVLLGAGAGVFVMWALVRMMRAVGRLQASGNIRIESCLGAEGEVYTSLPAGGRGLGQVRVIVSGRQRIYNAASEGAELPTGSRVRVTRVNENNTLTVAPAGAR